MAIINLGSIKFNWQGAYDNATAYAVDDVVSSGGNSYVCIAATTGNTPPNATYWELMAQAGTNGTDLTTTLTTQGDIVYRNASGLARLGAGTSGQVLQSGGTGANPSWGTVSSDFVKIAEVNITTNTAIATFDNVFSSSDGYDSYFLTFRAMIPATNAVVLRIRYLNSSGSTVSASYRWVNDGTETSSGGTTNNGQFGGATGDSEYQVAGIGGTISNNTLNNGINGSLSFYNPELSGKTLAEGQYVHFRNPLDNLFRQDTASVIDDTQVMRGFIMYFSSGDIANGKMTLYGRK